MVWATVYFVSNCKFSNADASSLYVRGTPSDDDDDVDEVDAIASSYDGGGSDGSKFDDEDWWMLLIRVKTSALVFFIFWIIRHAFSQLKSGFSGHVTWILRALSICNIPSLYFSMAYIVHNAVIKKL